MMKEKRNKIACLESRLKDIHQMSKPPRRYSGYGQNKSFFSKTFTDVESPPGSHDSQADKRRKNGKIRHHCQFRHECLCTISYKMESNASEEALLSSGRNVPTRSL